MRIEKRLLNTRDAAWLLDCSQYFIYRLIHTGLLPAYKDCGGRLWHIPEESIKNYMDSRLTSAARGN